MIIINYKVGIKRERRILDEEALILEEGNKLHKEQIKIN